MWLVDFGPAQAIGRNLPWSPYIHICNILVITELAVNALVAAMYYKCRLKCSLRPIITPEYLNVVCELFISLMDTFFFRLIIRTS